MDTWVVCAGLVAHRKCRNLSQTYFFSLNHWCSFVPQPWSVETTLIKYIWVISGRSLTWIQATHELHFVHEEPWLTSHLANSYSSSLITSGSLCMIVDLNFSRSLNHDTKNVFQIYRCLQHHQFEFCDTFGQLVLQLFCILMVCYHFKSSPTLPVEFSMLLPS